MTDTIDFADVFEQAAEVISAGWRQGDYFGVYSDGPHYCAIGALGVACGEYVDVMWYPGMADILRDTLVFKAAEVAAQWLTSHMDIPESRYNMGTDIVVNWNDSPETTKDDVADVFRRVAKDLRNEATP